MKFNSLKALGAILRSAGKIEGDQMAIKTKLDTWLVAPQPYLGGFGILCMMVFASFVTPLSLDMYTPALPSMASYFGVDVAIINLTLPSFYIFFALSQLYLGTLSDRKGRKKLFLAGALIYAFGSLLCALATHVFILILVRIVQAFGAGALGAISMAMIKDVFTEEKRNTVLSIAQAVFAIAPVVAPVLGAFLIKTFSWRATFFAVFVFGLICFVFGLMTKETLPLQECMRAESSSIVGEIFEVLKDKGFTLYLFVAAIFSLPFMAYISVAPHIYITFFGLSEMEYSYYFGAAMIMMAIAPLVMLAVLKKVKPKVYMHFLIIAAIVVGILLLLFGAKAPISFCLIFTVFIFLETCIRPFSTTYLMSQQPKNAGTVSALINTSHTVTGFIGMLVSVLPWVNYLFGLGIITVVAMIISGIFWIYLLKSKCVVKGLVE